MRAVLLDRPVSEAGKRNLISGVSHCGLGRQLVFRSRLLDPEAFLSWTGTLVVDIRTDLTNLRDAKR